MSRPPALTDRTALERHRARAAHAPALFLHEHVSDEVNERLAEVKRTFTSVAVVTGSPDFWAKALPDARIVADTPVLVLEPEGHDLVVHALALHWADDPVGQLVQCRRALRPDGLFLGFCFGGQTLAELRAILSEAEVDLCGGLSPRVLPMGEIRDLGALLQRAGFALPVADSVPLSVNYRDAYALMRDLRAMGETNALAARHRVIPPRALFAETAARYAAAFPAPGQRIRATFEIIALTGWAPADSQQKPLRPGSAGTRLASVLGTVETRLPDSTPWPRGD